MESFDFETKTFIFAVRIVEFSKLLISERQGILSRQLIRAGTSIGYNVKEAQSAESKDDFIHKMSISQKETDETIYWLELISTTEVEFMQEIELLLADANEILKIIKTIISDTKKNLKTNS